MVKLAHDLLFFAALPTTTTHSPEKIYEENGGDLDRIAVAMGGIQWKPDLPAIRDARDFAEKILAGSLVRSTTRAEGGAVWKPDAEGKSGGGADASAGGK